MISQNIKNIVANIRQAIYGTDVRESIAKGIEAIAEEEVAHKVEVEGLINEQNVKVDALGDKFEEVLQSGTDNPNMLEIVEARGGYANLGARLTAEQLADILLGAERNRLLKTYDIVGELLGKIDNQGIYFSKISSADIDCPIIPKMINGGTFYVDSGALQVALLSEMALSETGFNSLTQCADYFRGKVIDEDITIVVRAGEYKEHVLFSSILGSGRITLQFEEGAKIHGGLYFHGIHKTIIITGNKAEVYHGGETTKANGAIYFDNCSYAYVRNLRAIGINNVSDWGIIAYRGSNVILEDCIITGFNHWGSALSSQYNSKMVVKNCKGSTNNKSIHALYGSSLLCEGTIPKAAAQGNNDITSTIALNGAVQTEASSGETGTVPPASTEKPTTTSTLNTSKITSWCGNYGWNLTTGSYQHKLYSGKYYASNSESWNWRGYIGYDRSSFLSITTGKEIVGIKMKIARKSVGGDAESIKVRLYGTTSTGTGSAPSANFDYGYVAVIKKGETLWIDLPATAITHMKNYNIAGFLLYHPQGSGEVQNYGIFEDTTGQLQITVR